MELNIPVGINYECTGCGKCCSGWSVPLTEADYKRIVAIDWTSFNPDLNPKKLFRELKSNEKLNTSYTHAINPNANGQCPFLKDNLCFIHSQFGSAVKPAICQLFPYSFNETPDGIFTTVSFISRGAIFNAGRSLLEQKDYLKIKYAEFKKLFPNQSPNWSALKLSSNLPLSWREYIEIERPLLVLMQEFDKNIEDRFIEGSFYLQSTLIHRLSVQSDNKAKSSAVSSPRDNGTHLNKWDKMLFLTLYKRYFQVQKEGAKAYGQLQLTLFSFIKELFNQAEYETLISEVKGVAWPKDDAQIKGLINRFFYSRFFCKLYFGAGFGQLSLIAGFNHLAFNLALLKLKARQIACQSSKAVVDIDDVVKTIVQLEKSLGELKISPYGAAILELLLFGQQRIARLFSLF